MAEQLASMKTTAPCFVERAANGSLEAALALLNRNGGQPPVADDELPSQPTAGVETAGEVTLNRF